MGLLCGFEQQRGVTFAPELTQHKFGRLFETWLVTDDGKNSFCLKDRSPVGQ